MRRKGRFFSATWNLYHISLIRLISRIFDGYLKTSHHSIWRINIKYMYVYIYIFFIDIYMYIHTHTHKLVPEGRKWRCIKTWKISLVKYVNIICMSQYMPGCLLYIEYIKIYRHIFLYIYIWSIWIYIYTWSI